MIIKNDEHIFLAGQTGSGKSFLAEQYLLYPKKHVLALDVKGTMTYKADETITKISELYKIDFRSKKKPILKIIYQPNIYELNLDYYEEFFKFCYDLKNCTIICDEVTAVCKNAFTLPFYYMSILSRGRSRNTNIWSLSQRPAMIPIHILSESIHWFVFNLSIENDRKRLSQNSGQKEFLLNPLQKFTFHYFNTVNNYYNQGILINNKEVKI